MKQFEGHRIEFLTSKFLEGGLSAKELVELKQLLWEPDLREYFKQNYILWNAPSSSDEDIERAWQRVMSHIKDNGTATDELIKLNKKDDSRIRRFSWIRTVAAVFIAFVLGMSAYYFVFDSSLHPFANYSGDMKLGKSSKITTNRITVPLGSKSKIDLPDGTTVVLNAGSNIEYSTDYGTTLRSVKLEGEAYFKVAKNPDCPFIVSAKNTTIKALGTEFNVKAYVDEDVVQTTLVEGSVSINPNTKSKTNNQDIVLSPNQMATVYKSDYSISSSSRSKPALDPNNAPLKPITNSSKNSLLMDIKDTKVSMQSVNPILYTSWKDERWVIESEEMESLALKLQRRYDVNVVIASPGLNKYKFSGILKDETLEQVLDIMKTVAPINYYIDKKTVIMSINPEQRKAFERSMNY